jgi:hypothetical protein
MTTRLRSLRTLGCLFIPALLFAGGAYLLVRRGPPFFDVRVEGAQIAEQLEEWRAAHGSFPRSLDEAGIEPEEQRFGGFRYQLGFDGQTYELWIGDQERDGVEMRWPKDEDDQ